MDRLPSGLPPPSGLPAPPHPRATLEQRVTSIKQLIDEGLVDRVMLGTDSPIGRSVPPTAVMQALHAQNPDGINFVRAKVIPRLIEIGVQETAIRTMTVENPKRYLDGA